MKCPNCRNEVNFWTNEKRQASGEVHCPNCPAVLKTTARFRASMGLGIAGFPIITIVVVLLVIMYLGTYGGKADSGELMFLIGLGILPYFLIVVSIIIRVKKIEVVRLRPTCKYCSAVMVLEDAEFCPNCGASMEHPAWERITITEQQIETQRPTHHLPKPKPVGTCLVCDLEMNESEVLACCPHCGNTFHKVHLIEWVHLRKSCPACGKHLEEPEIKDPPLHSNKRQTTKKKWKRVSTL
ncbi:MAG: hypothetical protein WED05_08815 [Candidatus Atabeyarchaeum deiterrae]